MRKEKSPGLKILWLWTFGTAAILVGNMMRTRIRDMETLMNAEQQQQHNAATSDSLPQVVVDTLPTPSDTLIPEDKD
ncbi:hypothetical protein RIF29_38232 [Crotalaria pallida]|uniref:Uncharacterized protein n=1 Tax=Crotalaria pallida TaxID=3830 RepID=A0AAN9HNR0_CROPI